MEAVAEKCGAVLKQLTPDENGEITDKSLEVITDKTRLVAVTQVSNVLGRVNDIKHIAEVAHAHGVLLWLTEHRVFLICRLM